MLVHVSHHEQQILSGIKWFGPHQHAALWDKKEKTHWCLFTFKKNNNNEISVLYSGRG